MSTELDKQARELEIDLKILARLLDRMHMFVPKLKGDPTCHYCGNQYEHEVHWREGECSWSAKYRVISEYLAAFASQVREQSKWVSVAEGLPKTDRCVLVYVPGSRCQFGAFLSSIDMQWHVFGGGGNAIYGDIFHWSELPAPPETTEQEERSFFLGQWFL